MVRFYSLFGAQLVGKPTLPDQHRFTVSEDQSMAFLALLDRPAKDNIGLMDLMSRQAPWKGTCAAPKDS